MTKFDDITEKVIETIDENGNKVYFELIDIIELDKQEYACLYPISDDEQIDEEDEYIVMRLLKNGEEYSFEAIEDDDEFQKISDYISSIEDVE